ncbi:hypothetical protein DPMN_008095 [Dreissena polymorpha]|uniref:Uncharacterized protein n=1 Tax=Dreissena polymorpha TaxID=45954 RepID=A0A9D4MYK5_DREPO|nr:hypothetical protein DPMN_008095 [Dreissena polymorpha]
MEYTECQPYLDKHRPESLHLLRELYGVYRMSTYLDKHCPESLHLLRELYGVYRMSTIP